jgi:hypothetical protein
MFLYLKEFIPKYAQACCLIIVHVVYIVNKFCWVQLSWVELSCSGSEIDALDEEPYETRRIAFKARILRKAIAIESLYCCHEEGGQAHSTYWKTGTVRTKYVMKNGKVKQWG